MLTIDSPELSRNYGYWNQDEQRALLDSRVAIGGVGGAGFPLGLALARAGVTEFAVADPDTIAETNFNRHPGAFVDTLGKNKAEVFADMVKRINPDVTVDVYTEGVNADNVEDFVTGADLVFDGIDFNHPAESVRLHRQARAMGRPVLTGLEIGPSAVVTSFRPDGITFEEAMGYKPNDTLEQIAEKTADGVDLSASVAYLPYKSTNIKVMEAVQKGAELPTTVFGVDLFGAATGQEAFNHLTAGVAVSPAPRSLQVARNLLGHVRRGNNRREPVWAPDYLVVDLERMKTKVIRQSRPRFYMYATLLSVRSKLGLNPDLVYGDDKDADF
ncbi:MAG: hypothetical protein JWP13_625 [Candidatus Saccharibacteria bacterium]|nr:hypothetical protein [Candidatus Saccharibacteria bacterium]